MKLTPEQSEEQRPIFEARFSDLIKSMRELNHINPRVYRNNYPNDKWEGWLAAIESQPKREIRLPNWSEYDTPQDYQKVAQIIIESQGYTVSEY